MLVSSGKRSPSARSSSSQHSVSARSACPWLNTIGLLDAARPDALDRPGSAGLAHLLGGLPAGGVGAVKTVQPGAVSWIWSLVRPS